jgi:NAD+-dependent secondary alcohol dehydrogenase Adh1
MAEFMRTNARSCVKLDPGLRPADVAALADTNLTAYHAVRKAVPLLYPGAFVVAIGTGGLGHIGIQALVALTAAETSWTPPKRPWNSPRAWVRTTPCAPTATR